MEAAKTMARKPATMVGGAYLLANLPSKTHHVTNTTTTINVVTQMADSGRHGATLPAPLQKTVNQHVAESGAPWWPWDEGQMGQPMPPLPL